MELTNRTAVVTGASGGLGGEIAVGLARAGCNLILHCNKHLERAEKVAARVRELGRNAAIMQADFAAGGEMQGSGMVTDARKMVDNGRCEGDRAKRDGDGWREIFAEREGFEPARILVNSAALFGRTPVGNIEGEEAMKMLEMDLLVPILLCQEFAEFLTRETGERREETVGGEEKTSGRCSVVGGQREEKEVMGKIVNIADVGGERVWKGYSVYCAAKAGLIAATKVLAKELAPRITVNAVAPGLVTWPEGMDEAGKARQLGFVPAGRIARPEEIAAAVVFLLQNDYITGQVVNVDGGRTV